MRVCWFSSSKWHFFRDCREIVTNVIEVDMQHLQVQVKDILLAFKSLTYFILDLLRERQKTCKEGL